DHVGGALAVFDAVPQVTHSRRPPGTVIDIDADNHRVGAHLRPVGERVRDVTDERGRLRVHLASLKAEPAVDAVWPVAEPAVGDGYGTDSRFHPCGESAALEDLAVPAHRVGALGIRVGVAPGPILPSNGELR